MTKEQFYNEAKRIAGKRIADEMLEDIEYFVENENNGVWDENAAKGAIDDLMEEFRFFASVDHYRDCGY